MRDDQNNGLSESEKRALQQVLERSTARDELEERTVRELRGQGLVVSRKRRIVMHVFRTAAIAATAAVVFIAGIAVGKRSGNEPATSVAADEAAGSQFMLLLYTHRGEDMGDASDVVDARMAAIIDEYRAWANQMAERGQLVSAEKLRSTAAVMMASGDGVAVSSRPGGDSGRVLGGYFLIRAANLDDAVALARTHPHLKYNGEIEIRPIHDLQ
jgi:hypothetical protein